MKSQEIENRDKELIEKFRTIIRNKKTIEEKPTPKSVPFGLIFLLTILIIFCLLFFKEQPRSHFSQESKPSSEGQRVPAPEKILNQKEPGVMPSGIRIEEIISCSRVNNRQHSSSKIEFSIAQDAAPKIWMKVISENPPLTLTHVYYCNGIKYCDVPLAIRYHRMRTWSTVSLRAPEQIGQWRVDVIDESGVKLDQIEFRVVK